MRKILYFGLILIGSLLMSTCDLFTPGFGSNVDLSPPLLFVTSHSNGSFVSGTITLAGNFEEDVATAAVAVSFDNGATWSQAALNQSARTWSLSFDTTPLPDGERDVLFRITDTSNKTTDKQLMLYFDNTAPLVMMTVPTVYGGSATYYGSIFSVKGETADTFGVQSVSVQIWDDAEATLLATLSASGTSSWTSTFNSATYVPASGTIRFTIIATDKAGNVSTRYYHSSDVYSQYTYSPTTPYTIDYVYQCLTDPASSALKTYLLANGTTRIPLYFDQAYNLPTIEVYNPDQNQPPANNVLTSTSRLSGKAIDEDGILANSVEIYIIKDGDTLPTIDWTSTGNPLSPSVNWSYLLPGPGTIGNGSYTLRVRATDQGSNQRTSNAIGFVIDNDIPILAVTQPTQGQYLNGNFTVEGTATDSGWITNVEVSLDDGATYNNATLSLPNWSYTVTTPPDGSMLIKVRATDNTAKTAIYNLQVVVDRTNPTIGFTNPPLSSTVNGQVIFKGTSSDNTQITKVELKIGNSDPFIQLAGTYNWEYTIDSTSYANATHSTETPPGSDVWRLDVQARATDVANNVFTLTSYYIFIDNDTDKPHVNIVAPSSGQNLGGPVLVTGIAWDDDGVASVQMQIDINGDGDFTDAIDIGNGTSKTLDADTTDRFENESQWFTLTGTTAWSETLNQFGELYERTDTTPDLTGDINVRVRAVDINAVPIIGNFQQISIHCDDTIPRIENLNYQSSDYVKGDFTLNGDAYDDVRVSTILISYNGGVDYFDITNNALLVTRLSDDHCTLHIPIDSTSYIPTSGIFYLRLKTIDNANYQTISYLNLNVDNVRPTGTSTPASQDDIYGSTANSRIQGQAWDSGVVCGIEKIEVYFTRGSGPYTLVSPIGLPDGTPITYDFGDGNVQYVQTADKPSFLISIDKMTELGNDGSGNGDGDGYNESLTLSGSDYNWWAEFDSNNITDGLITIHYVVFDKAQNGHHYQKSGFIKNHKPQITVLTVGTDLDVNGSVSVGEQFTYAASFNARNRVYFGITASDPGGGIASYQVYHPNASGTLIQSAATGTTDISTYAEGATTFLCRVTDTDGIIVDQTVDVVIDNIDTVDPTVSLTALAQTDRTTDALTGGHIELTGESTYNGSDADVSGTVVLRGHAHDNQRVQYFKMTIENYDCGGGTGLEATLATWPQTNTAGTYGNLTISNVSLTESTGHDFDWTYTWNTANVTNRTGLDITVTVKAEDFNTPTPHAATAPRDHDVVPYITGILRDAVGTEGTTRSKFGKFPVQEGEATISVNGYNLAKTGTYGTNSWVRVYNTSGAANDEIPTGSVSVNGTYTTLTLSNLSGVTHSGFLRVQVNNIEAVNYNNNNNLLYNKEDDGSGLATTRWTDDRYLQLWRAGASFNSSSNAQYPAMGSDSSGNLYGSWTDYTTAASVFYGTTAAAPTSIFQMYDPAEYSDIHIDASNNITAVYLGNYYGGSGWDYGIGTAGAISVWTSTAPQQVRRGFGYPWNNFHRFEMLYHDQMLLQFQRPKIARSGNNIHLAYYDLDTNSVKYGYVATTSTTTGENGWINLDGGSDADDVRHLTGVGTRPAQNRLVDTALIGNTLIANGQTVYLHDTTGNTGQTTVQSFTSGTGTVNLNNNIDTTYTSYTIITTTDCLVTQGAARSSSVGTYVAIEVDEQGYPVVMYYDIYNQTLKMARATSQTPSTPADWYRQSVFQAGDSNKNYVGQHITVKFNATGILYAACYRVSTGDLIYITAPDADGADYSFNLSTVIDSDGAVGSSADISLNGSTPYISYLNSSMIGTFSGLKMAYYDTTISNWEYSIAPLSTAISDNRTNIEYRKGAVDWTVSIGYKGSAFDIVQLKPEE